MRARSKITRHTNATPDESVLCQVDTNWMDIIQIEQSNLQSWYTVNYSMQLLGLKVFSRSGKTVGWRMFLCPSYRQWKTKKLNYDLASQVLH